MQGKVLALSETLVDGKVVRSPDHPAVTTPAAPGGTVDFQVRRSRGFEGMAASKDGSKLYVCWSARTFCTRTNETWAQAPRARLCC